MAIEWYCRMLGTELGPYTSAELIELARQQRLTPEDWVRKGKDGQWVAAYRVQGLFHPTSRPSAVTRSDPAHGPPKASPKLPTARDYERLVDTIEQDNSKRDRTLVDWFCICNGEKRGPISFAQLKQLAATGQLGPRARVWTSASPKWCRAEDVPGLMG